MAGLPVRGNSNKPRACQLPVCGRERFGFSSGCGPTREPSRSYDLRAATETPDATSRGSDDEADPDGYHTVTPYLMLDDAAAAIEFYKQAFGPTERMRMDAPDGRSGTPSWRSATRS